MSSFYHLHCQHAVELVATIWYIIKKSLELLGEVHTPSYVSIRSCTYRNPPGLLITYLLTSMSSICNFCESPNSEQCRDIEHNYSSTPQAPAKRPRSGVDNVSALNRPTSGQSNCSVIWIGKIRLNLILSCSSMVHLCRNSHQTNPVLG